jgi:hypothetical protein
VLLLLLLLLLLVAGNQAWKHNQPWPPDRTLTAPANEAPDLEQTIRQVQKAAQW